MPKAAFFSDRPDLIEQVYGEGRKALLEGELEFFPRTVTSASFPSQAAELHDLEVIFSTWGMPALTGEQIAGLPALKAIFYAAGSVQYFARPFLERGVQVVSAWASNGVPVSQFTLAQIILAAKGYFAAERQSRTPQGRAEYTHHSPGMFHPTIALLGAGMIGARVIELLHAISEHSALVTPAPDEIEILVYDPYLSEARAAALGVQRVSLAEAFERAIVVSNHIPDLPDTRGMLTGDLFARMRPYATFINTGRGATIDEAGMAAVLQARPDLIALLDVSYPEPPLPDSPLYQLENVRLSPHIAGSTGREVVRHADCMIDEWRRLRAGQPLRWNVTLEMLKTMA